MSQTKIILYTIVWPYCLSLTISLLPLELIPIIIKYGFLAGLGAILRAIMRGNETTSRMIRKMFAGLILGTVVPYFMSLAEMPDLVCQIAAFGIGATIDVSFQRLVDWFNDKFKEALKRTKF